MTSTERTYYVIFSLYTGSAWFLAPIYALFLLSRGLDLFEINVVLATYLITVFLFEVPTGAVADLAGRKASFLLSCAVRMVAFALYAFADGFVECLVAEFVDAIGSTLASGALDAWAVDGMRAEGDQRPTDHFFARAHMMSRLFMIASGVACGYLAGYDLALPWLVAAAGFGATGMIAAATMREERLPTNERWSNVHRSLGRTVRDAFVTVRTTPVLLLLCVLTLATAFGGMPIAMMWQPRLQSLSVQGMWLMGWIWALLNLSCVAGNLLLPRLLRRVAREHVLCAGAIWRGSMLALTGMATGFYPALAGLLGQETGFGLKEPLIQAWTNEHVASAQRATILSVRSMFFTLGGSAGLVVVGLIARDVGIASAWLVSAAVIASTAPGFLLLGVRARSSSGGNLRPAGRGSTPISDHTAPDLP